MISQSMIKDCGNSNLQTSNKSLIALGKAVKNSHPIQAIANLPFAISKVINEVCSVFTDENGMHLNNAFHTYAKITALIMLYDACKAQTSPDQIKDMITAYVNEKQGDARIQASKAQIIDFLPKLLASTQYDAVSGKYSIDLPGYAITIDAEDKMYIKPSAEKLAHIGIQVSEKGVELLVSDYTMPGQDAPVQTVIEADQQIATYDPELNAAIQAQNELSATQQQAASTSVPDTTVVTMGSTTTQANIDDID